MKKVLVFSICGILASLFITSCGFRGAEEAATSKVEDLLDGRVINGGLFDDSSYSPEFWNNIEKSDWDQLSAYLDKTHGKLKNYKIISTNSKGRKKGLSAAGWVGFKIATEYENGTKGAELINFYRNGKDAPFKCITHNIQTEILNKLSKK